MLRLILCKTEVLKTRSLVITKSKHDCMLPGEKVVIKVNESYIQGYKIHFVKQTLWTKVNEFSVKANKNLIQNQSRWLAQLLLISHQILLFSKSSFRSCTKCDVFSWSCKKMYMCIFLWRTKNNYSYFIKKRSLVIARKRNLNSGKTVHSSSSCNEWIPLGDYGINMTQETCYKLIWQQ